MRNPNLLFGILIVYIFLQFSWWAYLLIDLHGEVQYFKSELLQYNPDRLEGEDPDRELKRRRAMVLGEGAVFLSLLIIGILQTRKAVRHEFELARQQRNFLLSVTHEFKSPLAAIKLNLQTLQKRKLEEDTRNHLLHRSLLETERINLLVENALIASRLDNNSFDLNFIRLDLNHFLDQLLNEYEERYDHRHSFKRNLSGPAYILADELALTSLVLNLLENAEKYSPPESEIYTSTYLEKQEVVLSISDRGIGIPEREKKKIFTKFYRIGNEDTRKTKGTGLGLYIVSEIAGLHKATIRVENRQGGGTSFSIRFPLS